MLKLNWIVAGEIGYNIFVNNFLFSGKVEGLFITGFNNSAPGDITRDILRPVHSEIKKKTFIEHSLK